MRMCMHVCMYVCVCVPTRARAHVRMCVFAPVRSEEMIFFVVLFRLVKYLILATFICCLMVTAHRKLKLSPRKKKFKKRERKKAIYRHGCLFTTDKRLEKVILHENERGKKVLTYFLHFVALPKT